MGLAGGRDVFNGKLGKPDDWSFTTKGRVWLNQNWGCDALMYAAFKAGGEGGLLALKALMLLAIAGVAVAAARRRGAGWTPAILVVAAAMAVTRYQMELRASLATFLMARLLLLVLYQSGRRQRLIWLAVPLVAVWSALHGGYTLGLVFRCV
jgi:asparagine N-glycosylation enzyme membrane subunit Stt3